MEWVIVVYDTDTDEMVCVATSVPKAIQYMVKSYWIDGDTPTDDWEGRNLQERFGDNWQDVIEKMGVGTLNELFDGLSFRLTLLIQ